MNPILSFLNKNAVQPIVGAASQLVNRQPYSAQQNQSPIPQSQMLTPKQIYDQQWAETVKAKGGYVDGNGVAHFDNTHKFNVPQLIQQARNIILPAPQTADAQDVSQANSSVQPNITIPYSQGGKYTLPAGLSQTILNAFNDTNEATNAAKVLNHPAGNSYISSDPESNNHINYGENAGFKTVKDATNSDGSIDRGLFRINSNTFKGYMSNPQSRSALEKMGITSYDDMNDPQKNASFAALLQKNAGWSRWFAAPQNLRLND